jgi:hypothetical protein
MLTYADVCWRMLTYADVCWRMPTYADVCWRMPAYADVCWQRCAAMCSDALQMRCRSLPAYVGIRRHTSACVSIRRHTCWQRCGAHRTPHHTCPVQQTEDFPNIYMYIHRHMMVVWFFFSRFFFRTRRRRSIVRLCCATCCTTKSMKNPSRTRIVWLTYADVCWRMRVMNGAMSSDNPSPSRSRHTTLILVVQNPRRTALIIQNPHHTTLIVQNPRHTTLTKSSYNPYPSRTKS